MQRRDHLHHADPTWPFLSHLRHSAPVYRALYGHPLLYQNRLLTGELVGMFGDAGFEAIAVRRMILPDRRYVDTDEEALAGAPGLDRSKLAVEFAAIGEADLRTAAVHLLFRRP